MKSPPLSSTFTVLLFAGALAAVLLGRTTAERVGALGLGQGGSTRIDGATFPKVVVSPNGGRQTIPGPPRRIVSLMLGADEILTRLVAPERIAAVSRFADNPRLSTCSDRVPKGAARIRGIDPEGILALEPDIVFAAGYTLESAVRVLAGAGVPVVRFGDYVSFADVASNVAMAGQAVGAEAEAKALVDAMYGRLEAVAARVGDRAPPRVLYYSQGGYTAGRDTLVDEKIRRAGGLNVVAEAGVTGPRHLGVDLLVTLDPDLIVLPKYAPGPDAVVRRMVGGPAWHDVRAVREGKVHVVDAKLLTAVSPDGVEGVEALARIFHAEAFSS